LPATGRETGIDVGLKVFRITANGESVANPRHYRHAQRRLQKAQRRVARRKKGSKRRRTAVGHLQRAHQTVQRQRTDVHHTTALALLRLYDTISLEDLRVANLVRNRSPGHEQQRCRLGGIPCPPRRHGSRRRASSCGGATRVHVAGL
jgi:putative transposase